jgi:replicative DNA helicase Mcm
MDLLPQGRQLKFKKNARWKGRESKWFILPPVMRFKNQNDPGALTEERRYCMDDWLEFLGYFISEGSVQFTNDVPYRVHISQVSSKEKIERIGNCLTRLGFKFSYDGHNFAISDKQLASHMSELGKTGDKHVPRDILQLSARQLSILLEALMLGDGTTSKTTGHRIYCTSSKRLADDVQEIVLKCGVAGNVRLVSEPGKKSVIRGRTIESTLPHFNVSILDGNGRNTCETIASAVGSLVLGTYILNSGMTKAVEMSRDSSIEMVEYSGMVHCVEVPNHVIYVRRNGIPVWCGNSVSVAKAGITARLQCRCSILGAANPKYGRFEESQFIADQIDLPPALMSRFDMIFAMTDKPDAEKDSRITKHILSAHRRGEIFENEDKMVEDSDDIKRMLLETEGLKPTYSKEFFRKYIAYSKRFSPILSDDAMRLITDNYLMIRKQGEGEGKSVPITARQLEAYVRLSEASARARLSKVVTLEDAKRAVGIVEYYLRKIAGEGGGLDIDIIATGTSKSQREQILVIRDLIRNNAEKTGIGIEQLIMLAKEENIPEERVRTLLKRLADNGEVYSPQGGFFKLASEGNE